MPCSHARAPVAACSRVWVKVAALPPLEPLGPMASSADFERSEASIAGSELRPGGDRGGWHLLVAVERDGEHDGEEAWLG